MLALSRALRARRNEHGFTLIEVLVVVLIIAILAAIAIPIFLGVQTQAVKSGIKQDVNNTVHRIQVALTREKDNLPAIKLNDGANYKSVSDEKNNEQIYVKDSKVAPGDPNEYYVEGTEKTDAGGRFTWTYWYDSALGQTGAYGESNTSSIPTDYAPTITSALPGNTATVGTAYSFTVTATARPAATFTATGLPTGLSINATTGLISGTPTVAQTASYTITAHNTESPDATQLGTIIVSPAPEAPRITSVSTLPSGRVNEPYDGFTIVSSGYPAPTFDIPGGLPTGLILNPATGTISGTPTGASGVTNFTITASNGVNPVSTQNVTLTLAPAYVAPKLTVPSLPLATGGKLYAGATITATGNPTPSITITGLPAGMSYTDNGNGSALIKGTPTATGSSTLTITAHNLKSPDDVQTATFTSNSASAATYTYDFNDSTVQGWTASSGALSVANNIGGHPKSLYLAGYLTNGNNNYLSASVNPAGTGVNFDAGHKYTITYSYYISHGYLAGDGTYITGVTMSGGQGIANGNSNNFSYSTSSGTWYTATTTWTQSRTSDTYQLSIAVPGYNGGTVGMYFDDIKIQQVS